MSLNFNDKSGKVQRSIQTTSVQASNITRRSALRQLMITGSAGFIAPFALSSSLFAADNCSNYCAYQMSFADWQELIGQRFATTVCQKNNETNARVVATLILEEVIEHFQIAKGDVDRPSGLRRAAISLFFSSDRDIGSATCRFENTTIGRTLLFVHPIPRDDRKDQLIFEVVLN